MAYERPITINEAINNIKNNKYLLPSIQREFVWGTDQITTLFDSLMRGYPISTFLFWEVSKKQIQQFQFYHFLRKYHARDSRHNLKAELNEESSVIALLDGQQRMTSLYIALAGSYSEKRPHAHWSNPNAFPEKKMYLNLFSAADSIEYEYDFRFLTQEEAKPSEGSFWFECGKILDFKEADSVMEFIMENELMDPSRFQPTSYRRAAKTLSLLRSVIHEKGTISAFHEKDSELDKVLQIFIRVNSGGTKLSHSDLLLSIATAQWQDTDAREVIHGFVDEINNIGDGFSFNKDLILKACLVLADLKDIKFKVDNFNKENMRFIEQNWEKTTNALRAAVNLVAMFGFNKENLSASYAIIPIAYYIYKNECENHILHAGQYDTDRKAIREWLMRVLLKRTFGGQPDSIYPGMRKTINENSGRFPLPEIIDHYRGSNKSISFSEEDIESILDLQYSSPRAFSALTLLYSGLNHNFRYHKDHIHPKARFSKAQLKKMTLTEDQIGVFQSRCNELANLQLLQANQNIEKTDRPFSEWLQQTYPLPVDQQSFLLQNHINSEDDLNFSAFITFMDNRRQRLKLQLLNMLSAAGTVISETIPPSPEGDNSDAENITSEALKNWLAENERPTQMQIQAFYKETSKWLEAIGEENVDTFDFEKITPFYQALEEHQLSLMGLDWMSWHRESHCIDNPESWVKTADMDNCLAWFTALSRAERFNGGSIASSINNKTLHRVIERTGKLLSDN